MSRVKKSRRRLWIIVGVVGGLAVAGGGAYGVRQFQLDGRARDARATGVAALEAKDYEKALDGLGRYLRRFETRTLTSEDYLLYGRARRNVPAANNKHLAGAIGVLRRALELDPASHEAQDELLAVYEASGMVTEAQDLLEKMIAARPGEVALLRKKADWLEALRKFSDALVVAHELSGRRDASVDDLVRTLRLMVRSEKSTAEVDAWIEAVAAARPGDRTVDLLRAAALSQRNEREAARKIIDSVVESNTAKDDPRQLELLVQQLDGTGRFGEALDVLEKLADAQDPNLQREIVRRLWFSGRAEPAIDRVTRWWPDPKTADPEMMAIRALALVTSGRRAEAEPIRAELAARTDPAGKAWNGFVDLAFREGPRDLAKSAATLRDAVATVPDSALLLAALGDACAAQGEWDAAQRAWQAAIARAPSWAHPFARLASTFRTLRRPVQADQAAQLAVLRAPQSVEAVTVWVEVRSDAAEKLTPAQVGELLKVADTLKAVSPQTAEKILPVRVGLLARTDRPSAEAELRAVIDAPGTMAEDTLLRLADVAGATGIPLEKELVAAAERRHGVTPRLALARAVVVARAGGATAADDGLRVLDELRAKAGPEASEPAGQLAWDLVRASYLEAIRRPEAGAAWKSLSERHTDSIPAQLGALASASHWSDRAAVAQTIDRLKALTGEGGATWRTARARLLLEDPAAPEQDLAEAAGILESVLRGAPENVSALLLLAKCQERLGRLESAEGHLTAAAVLDPSNSWIVMESARLAQRRGQPEEARRKLDKVLTTQGLAPEHMERAAYLLAAQGDLGRSAELLQQLAADPNSNRESRLLLAQLHARLGRTDQAIALLEELLDRPTAQVVETTAQLYAAVGRGGDAAALLAKLDTMDLRPGDRDLIRARHAARWESPAAARSWLEKAVAAAPDRADVWHATVVHALATGDVAAFDAVLDDPRAAGVPSVRFFSGIRDVCRSALPNDALRSLLLAALDDESARDVLVETVRVLAREWPEPTRRAAAAKTVQGMAESNVKVLPLQLVAADVSAQAGDLRTGLEIAKRTMTAFPNSDVAARQAAQLLARSSQWDEAMKAALVWRDRAGRQDPGPDAFVASALLRLNRPKDAAAGLEPLSEAALAHPDKNEMLLLLQAAALSRSGDGERAGKLLRSLAAASEKWRTIPLILGPSYMGTAAESVAWLNLCSSLVPESDAKNRLMLARAWGAAWEQFRDPALLAGARGVVGKLTAKPDAPPDAHFLSGTLSQGSGDLARAKTDYEAALARDPEFVVARNNLAMVLSDAGQWEAAVAEATRICEKYPRSSEFLDTLSYAYRKGGKYAEARAQLERAIALEPANPTWRISLAETLVAAGDVNGLAAVLADIRRMETDGAPFTADQRARLEKVRPSRR